MINLLIRKLVPGNASPDSPAVRQRCGTLSGLLGIILNLLLCAGKLIVGLLTASISVMADAFNNLTDAGSSIITLIGFRLAGQKADDEHPFGHGRAEYLAGLIISLLILLVGVELGKSSVEKILHPEATAFTALSAAILIASVCVKLWMYCFNRALGKRLDSAALTAAAADSLADVAATTVVLLGLAAGHLWDLHIDGWLGVAVALFILYSGLRAVKDTMSPLLGQSPDPALVKGIHDTVLSHDGILGLHDLIIHDYGPGRRMVSLHVEIPSDAHIMEAHDAIDHIERELRDTYGIEAVIHMDPIITGDETVDHAQELVLRHLHEINPAITIHDFRMADSPLETKLIFDIVLPYDCPLSDEQIKEHIGVTMRRENERYQTVVVVDRPYA